MEQMSKACILIFQFFFYKRHLFKKRDAFLHWHRKWQKLANMESEVKNTKVKCILK